MESDKGNTMLVDSVQLAFGKKTVLQSAFITAECGKVTGVLGRNGAGKSCLFRCIMGIIKPQNIFVRFNDETRTDYVHIGRRVKYLPQHNLIPPQMTLATAFGMYGVDYNGLVEQESRFHRYRDSQPRELSGGEVRIAEMYLVLKADSDFCILDEPFSNIAPVYVEKMQAMILAEKQHKGIIISDHLYQSILDVSDTLYLLRDGYTFPVNSRDDLVRLGYLAR